MTVTVVNLSCCKSKIHDCFRTPNNIPDFTTTGNQVLLNGDPSTIINSEDPAPSTLIHKINKAIDSGVSRKGTLCLICLSD